MREGIVKNLRLFRELLTCAHNIWLWSYSNEMELLSSNCPCARELQAVLTLSCNTGQLLSEYDMTRPVVLTDQIGLAWIADYELNGDALCFIHVIGPVFLEDVSRIEMENALTQAGFSFSSRQELLVLLELLPVIPITRFFEYGLMLHYCIREEKIAISDLQYPETRRKNKHGKDRHEGQHGTWAMEQELLRLVETGNPDYRRKAARLVVGSNVVDLGSGSSLRHIKNVTIVFTALCTRASIRGGLPPEVSYSLSDRYIAAIETCASLPEVVEVNDAMQSDFVARVHQCKSGAVCPQIQKCCNYIQLHLEERLTVPDLARRMAYSENYLSRKFKHETGKSLVEYITEAKIQLAKDLLISGEDSVQDIAIRLGFNSQSYFGEIFRRYCGMTPGEYRQCMGRKPTISLSSSSVLE